MSTTAKHFTVTATPARKADGFITLNVSYLAHTPGVRTRTIEASTVNEVTTKAYEWATELPAPVGGFADEPNNGYVLTVEPVGGRWPAGFKADLAKWEGFYLSATTVEVVIDEPTGRRTFVLQADAPSVSDDWVAQAVTHLYIEAGRADVYMASRIVSINGRVLA